jgi:hypothetical protein
MSMPLICALELYLLLKTFNTIFRFGNKGLNIGNEGGVVKEV